eukprot:1693169-Alexandrium_andersonii.AAC.1
MQSQRGRLLDSHGRTTTRRLAPQAGSQAVPSSPPPDSLGLGERADSTRSGRTRTCLVCLSWLVSEES